MIHDITSGNDPRFDRPYKEPETRVITANIYGQNEDEVQTVFVYLTEEEPGAVSAEIKMPLFVTPSDIVTDVSCAMEEEGINDRLLNVETN